MSNSTKNKNQEMKFRFLSGKKNLLKKCTAFIVSAMMYSASTNAQIVYTDLIPDKTLSCSTTPCNQSYNLDLNNDGTTDFTLNATRYVSTCAQWYTTREAYISSQSGNGACALNMNANDIVDGNLTFSASNVVLRSITSQPGLAWGNCNSSSGILTNGSGGYLGLQFTNGNNTYFGWVHLNVSILNQGPGVIFLTVKDYAYNSIPNQPILAGQTVATGVNENSFSSSIHLFPNPASNNVTINLGTDTRSVHVSIADITGKIIYFTTASETQKLEVNTTDFTKGVYVVQIQTADFIGTKKLVIEK